MRRIALSLVALGATLCFGPAALRANTITVNSPLDPGVANDGKCTLREAVQEAEDDHPTKASQPNQDCDLGSGADVLVFTSKTKVIDIQAPIVLGSNLTLQGKVVIDAGLGSNQTRMFVIAGPFQIRFQRVGFYDAVATEVSGPGAAIHITTNAATVEIIECEFSGNQAFRGGAIANAGSGVTISETTFSANSAATNGGALAGSGNWTISRSTFDSNLARNGGGAIFCAGGQLQLDQVHFVSNTASGLPTETGILAGGGAIETGCKTRIHSSLFDINTAFGHSATGGAIFFLPSAESVVRQSVFSRNYAGFPAKDKAKGGGAIAAFGPLVVDRSAIERNTAIGPAGGGGIAVWGQAVLVVNSMLRKNFAALEAKDLGANPPVPEDTLAGGAGIAVWGAGAGGVPQVEVTNSTLSGDIGSSEIFLDPATPGAVVLRNTIVDGQLTKLNCEGNVANILDGPVPGSGHNLESDASLTPNCNLPVGKPRGGLKPGAFPQPAGTTAFQQALAFQYLVPDLMGDAVGAGDASTCLNAPVNALDILDTPRDEACTLGAAEAM